ncbi:hypothetical protein CCR75_005813 [Bremia lactucae]|uniref:GPI ethanolamine phosphate transferase 1 n=1 Tax=Bremia lactucae TaxID=4779 RepID=A0A976FN29_BRELC|nr:hypothetical protein CCR75_005813 [Bremia lactucae]
MKKVGDGLVGLLVLGVFFHAVYVLSIFDIYFTSPVVPHIENVDYTDSPPAKRVVVFVADGCRADKFFETNESTSDLRVSFLRNIMLTQGSWGVSHTRVPTESRPGHVALFAGMYEDVSAVTKGWADNPVDFDSIFNQSTSAFLFGSPDIVPMFARHVSHAFEEHYSHEEEDFAKRDASELDVWVFERLQQLLRTASTDTKRYSQLHQDGVVIFCHYLGIDSNGHAHRPNSPNYLNNIALVDELVEKSARMIDEFYNDDQRTAYVFTADHGMGSKGAHGDGDPANTRTPLVVWGAGVQKPTIVPFQEHFQVSLPTHSRGQIQAQLRAQSQQEQAAITQWGALRTRLRKDVMQADIAPLISALLGRPYPRNSVGVLPFSYLTPGAYRANAVHSNAHQLFLHAKRKEIEKKTHTLFYFQPYQVFHERVPKLQQELRDAKAPSRTQDDYKRYIQVETLSQELVEICLDTLAYFQRYDWFFLLSTVVLGYVGWILIVLLAYWHPHVFHLVWFLGPRGHYLDIKLSIMVFAAFLYLALEKAPLTYYLYLVFPLVFWNCLLNHRDLIAHTWNSKIRKTPCSTEYWKQPMAEGFLIVVCLELVVYGYERRELFSLLFSGLAFWTYVSTSPSCHDARARFSWPSSCWTGSCLLLSVFPLLPCEYGEHTALVLIGGLLLILATGGVQCQFASFPQLSSKRAFFLLRTMPVIISLITLQMTMQYLDGERSKPPFGLTLTNWLVASMPIAALFSSFHCDRHDAIAQGVHRAPTHEEFALSRSLQRLVAIMLAFGPSYILLSIAYEVLFYVVLCSVLVSWLLLEAHTPLPLTSKWREIQRAFVFLLLIHIAFFGTGNVASMSSFEISSTYRFVTVFAPFTMGALLVIKILIPFMLVTCTFHLILLLPVTTKSKAKASKHRVPSTRYFLLVVVMSDFLALQFLFRVKNEGSWKEIGNSISMFGIVNAQIVLIPVLFLLARVFVSKM